MLTEKMKNFFKKLKFNSHAKLIPNNNRYDHLRNFFESYVSSSNFKYLQRDLSLICDEQNKSFVDTWFAEKMIHDESYRIFSYFNQADYMILDIGANAGYSVSSMRSAGVICPIFSFEANKIHATNLEHIRKDIAPQYSFVYDYACLGLSDSCCSSTFLMPVINRIAISALARNEISNIDGLSSLLDKHIDRYFGNEEVHLAIVEFAVELSTLDRYVASNPARFPLPIAAIKVDAEGMEYKILVGSHDVLNKHHPLIMAEGESYELLNFLLANNYKKTVYSNGKLRFSGDSASCNTVYIHTDKELFYRHLGLIVD